MASIASNTQSQNMKDYVFYVSGCQDTSVVTGAHGYYQMEIEDHHGKPAFKRIMDGSGKATKKYDAGWIYFWDNREGAWMHGWWMGKKIGWSLDCWAYNSDAASLLPPIGFFCNKFKIFMKVSPDFERFFWIS
jgi:hypothetical protein